jgi:co-chaperonin GroES (HSP10)
MIKAVGFRVIVRPRPVEEVRNGIILAVDKGMEERAQVLGTIVDIGEDFASAFAPKSPFWGLSVGDNVFYAKYAGKWVTDPDTQEQLLIMNDEDIVAVVREAPDASSVVATQET